MSLLREGYVWDSLVRITAVLHLLQISSKLTKDASVFLTLFPSRQLRKIEIRYINTKTSVDFAHTAWVLCNFKTWEGGERRVEEKLGERSLRCPMAMRNREGRN